MNVNCVLIANRGEIAIRIARSLAEGGIRTVGVYARDDAQSLHVLRVDSACPLPGEGPAAYLDQSALIGLALEQDCQAVHPGYGFLSENAEFASACEAAGLIFIGPSPACLSLLGDKVRARQLAIECQVPVAEGTGESATLEQVDEFLTQLKQRHGEQAGIMLKALAGGGGRGMRPVVDNAALAEAYGQCRSEALRAFGRGDLYAERLVANARHIEVQVLGDASGAVSHLWERDCTLQRRHQKLVEVAPAPALTDRQRETLITAALSLASRAGLQGLATFEFLLDCDGGDVLFIEANPRLQVEHTVTETISQVDLVAVQTALAAGDSLSSLGLDQPADQPPRAMAIQLRVNLETVNPDGNVYPANGTITTYEPPAGPGVRVDGCGYSGYTATTDYDSLLAKLIVSGSLTFPALLEKAYRALCEFRLEGVASNLGFLRNLLRLEELPDYQVTTETLRNRLESLVNPVEDSHPARFFACDTGSTVSESSSPDPDAVIPEGATALASPVQGRIVRVTVEEGQSVSKGTVLAVVEAMKMEFEITAPAAGEVARILAAGGDSVAEGGTVIALHTTTTAAESQSEMQHDLDWIRNDLTETLERHERLQDHRRPAAVARRRKTGQRTARENLQDLLDEDSFVEYGALALAARRRRMSEAELMDASPADGLVAGIGTVNSAQFGDERARCLALAYDYTVFAGTQGVMNHKKTDRMLQLADRWSLPVVLFAEGGGGRPGDTDFTGVAGLDCHTFAAMARLSGRVPLVGIVSGRCFAGNAALLGCCDVIIATRNATVGMAGPAMIEGGGLGTFRPEEVGPVSMQAANGVIDIVVEDEPEAVEMARQYLGYAQGRLENWEASDQRLLRHLIPENRARVYDMRAVIRALADMDSVIELRASYASGMLTALVRIEGQPFGLMANNPMHLGGAIDAAAGDKAARFMRLCNALGLPIVSLCDTPGFMVGPDAEKQATVRRVSSMFVTAAQLKVPFFTVVLRKGYGLGAQAMAAGSFHSPVFTIGWPSSEFGAMGLEGAVRLGYAKELAAIENEQDRQQTFERMVEKAYEQGKGLNMASFLEIDAVIDPAETRRWLLRGVQATSEKDRFGDTDHFIDSW